MSSAEQVKLFDIGNISKYRAEILGVCAIWIMIMHGLSLPYAHLDEISAPLNTFLLYGASRSDMMILISGIGCYFSLSKDNHYDSFLKKRFIRVYIPFALISIPLYLYIDLFLSRDIVSALFHFSGIGFWITGNSYFWFIDFILLMYFLAPLMYKTIFMPTVSPPHTTQALFTWLGAVLALIAYVKEFYPDIYAAMEIGLCRVPLFIVGLWFGRIIKEKKPLPVAFYLFCIAVTALSAPLKLRSLASQTGYDNYVMQFTGLANAVTLGILFAALSSKWIHHVLAFLGNISLEIYLVQGVLQQIFMNSPLYQDYCLKEWCILMLITIPIAWLARKVSIGISKAFLLSGNRNRENEEDGLPPVT